MLGKSKETTQRDLFSPMLIDFIDKNHELVLLAERINWKKLEDELSVFYAKKGRSSMPIRLMVGCLILKRLYNLGDETLAKAWVMNPYMQYFCGEKKFQHKFPTDPSDFVHFRKRMGEKGMMTIFAHSVELHGKQAHSKEAVSDTTVQENNITFPTDAKLYKKIIDRCAKIAMDENIKQRQSYKFVSKQMARDSYNGKHPKRAKKAKKSISKLKTIAGRVVRELERKLPVLQKEQYEQLFNIFKQIIEQERYDKNKIYSIHKPFTDCISKGKAHKKYEFGNKVGILMHPKNLIITAVDAFIGNPHDNKTIEPLITQSEQILNKRYEQIIYDRGGRGKTKIGTTQVLTPKPPLKRDTAYQKRKKREKFRRRAAIEPVIGHLKKSFRLFNYLHGEESPKVNAILAAAGWNFKKLMEKLVQELLLPIFNLLMPNRFKFFEKSLRYF